VAKAADPTRLAAAFKKAIEAGREAFLGGAMIPRETAEASTPVVGTPFWHHGAP
jgi:thiazole synthase